MLGWCIRLWLWSCLLVTAGAADTMPPSPNVTPADYRLYPGDVIRVEVFDHPDLTCDIRIPPHGAVSFPLIGDLNNVAGQAVDEVRGELTKRLLDGYIRKANVSVRVITFTPRQIYVQGNVAKPGTIDLNPLGKLTAIQAISQVGGFLEDTNRAACVVIRDDPRQAGQKISLAIPSDDQVVTLQGDVELRPGDQLLIAKLGRIFIHGQVVKGGAIPLQPRDQLTVAKAIVLAGGFSQFAKRSEVQLLRPGQPHVVVDVKSILDGNRTISDPELREGDTVYVPESRF